MAMNETDDQEDIVPPPPPHIELLRIRCRSGDDGGQCISRVISYLDNNSRKAACISCTYLRDAVAKQVDRERTIHLQEPITLVAVESPCRVTDIDALPVAFESSKNEFKKHRDNDNGSSAVDPTDEVSAGEGYDWSWLVGEQGAAADDAGTDTEQDEPQEEEQVADVDPAAEAETEVPVNDEGLESKLKKLGGDSQVGKHVGEDVSDITASTISNEVPILTAEGTGPEDEDTSLQEVGSPQAKGELHKHAEKDADTATKRTILDEMDDLEEELSKHSSIVNASAGELHQVDQSSIEPSVSNEITVNEAELESIPSIDRKRGNVSTEPSEPQEMDLPDETESVCTTERDAQTDSFLSEVSSSGAHTPISFLSSKSYDDYRQEARGSQRRSFVDGLYTMPTVSTYSSGTHLKCNDLNSHSPTTSSPVTPIIDTPSPASLTGATRLEMGTSFHLGNGSLLQISGRTKQQNVDFGDTRRSSNGSSDDSDSMQQISLGSIQEDEAVQLPPNMPENHSVFTRLSDIRDVAKEEIPFDELVKPVARRAPVLSESMSSLSSSNRGGVVGPRSESPEEPPQLRRTTTDDVVRANPYSNMSCHTEDDITELINSDHDTAADVLAQLSDAALFGDTPKAMTEFMSEIVDSAKGAVSLLYLNGRRNEIDDHGPIKIGDKYYSHNEALNLWRKAKVKLEDRYHQVDKNGDVKMERATFFEKNSVFQEKPKKKEIEKCNLKEKEMSIDKMVKKYRILGRKESMRNKSRFDEFADESVGFGESVAVDGHIVSNNEDSSAHLSLDESKLSSTSSPLSVDMTSQAEDNGTTKKKQVSFSIEVGREVGDSESETMGSSDGTSETSESDFSPARNGSQVLSESSDTLDLNDRTKLNHESVLPPESMTSESTDKLNIETDSVAGKDSIPSHMGSNYGLEVTSLRGMSCNFVSGKSSEQVKLVGGRSVGKDGAEQSVLGSQYGTEVLFKPKSKVVTARKPRTLASHNMGVKKMATSARQVMKQGNNSSMGAGVSRQGNQIASGSNRGSSTLSTQQQRRAPSPSPKNNMPRSNQPVSNKLQKAKSMKSTLPLKLKLGKKKSVKP